MFMFMPASSCTAQGGTCLRNENRSVKGFRKFCKTSNEFVSIEYDSPYLAFVPSAASTSSPCPAHAHAHTTHHHWIGATASHHDHMIFILIEWLFKEIPAREIFDVTIFSPNTCQPWPWVDFPQRIHVSCNIKLFSVKPRNTVRGCGVRTSKRMNRLSSYRHSAHACCRGAENGLALQKHHNDCSRVWCLASYSRNPLKFPKRSAWCLRVWILGITQQEAL